MDTAGPMTRRVLNVIGHAQHNAGPARSDLSVHMAETSSGAATTARLKAMSTGFGLTLQRRHSVRRECKVQVRVQVQEQVQVQTARHE